MKLLIITAILLTACTITGETTLETEQEEHFNYTLTFCGNEKCLNSLKQQISNAHTEIKCALYNPDEEILALIEEKSRSITAEAVVDDSSKTNSHIANKRKASGIMHNKFCIFDGRTVWTGSFNARKSRSHDNVITINSTTLARNYIDEFEELKGNSSERTTTSTVILNRTVAENYFCPEDNCIEMLRKKLATAERSIYFATYSFTHPAIANELIIKKSEGVRVEGVIEMAGNSQLTTLQDNGINAVKDENRETMHNKFFIIDEEIVITGSFNPTRNADKRNDENMLVIHNEEVAGKYIRYFGDIRQKT